ncbi:MAG: FAD-dependent oxidoreductase [Oscillospiraceae bacterium]|jgi:NAD(P)H-nitrite reductase large subunit|nr:FAD-dependent oxidoreductase [Oscillospiraceae bacterium]
MKHVIIGNSAAAIGCVEGIRRQSRRDEIVLIASEAHHSYSRPLISYYLAGRTDLQRIKYRPDSFYKENNVTAMLGETVTALDPAKKTAVLQTGKSIGYDKLLVATGSSPVVFPAEGLEQVAHLRTFTTLEDALYLEQAVRPQSRVLIIGAGLIGLKCAEGLLGRAASVTVVDLAPRVLSSILSAKPAAIMQEHLRQHGIRFCLGTSAAKFYRYRDAYHAQLQDGETIAFDHLIYAAGVRANSSLVKEAGGETNRGIVVDAFSRTSLPDIYAAGDCTESLDVSSGERKVMALLPNAYLQGEAAGQHMAAAGGSPRSFSEAIPMNAIGFFGKHILSAGTYPSGEEIEVFEEEDGEGGYRCFYFNKAENRLAGYILIEHPVCAGIYTALVRERTPLTAEQFARLRENPGLIAFSPEVRAAVLRKKEAQA